MKKILPVYLYAYDRSVNRDGTIDDVYIHASTYEPDAKDKVVLGKSTVAFEMPDADTIKAGKLEAMEAALVAYRKESLAHIEHLQGRINELKALPQDVA